MNKLSYKFATGLAAASLFAFAAVPLAFADTGVGVDGNGAFSDNTVKVNNNDSTKVQQNNNTDITNKVNTVQNTGGNTADFNTGGSVTIKTGDANSNVNINNQAGENKAVVAGGGNGSNLVDVAGNGAFSTNKVKLNNDNSVKLNQNNNTDITNKVNTYQNTGNNSANFNTGTKVTIETGNANATTNINNQAGANFATVYNGKNSNDNLVDVNGNGAFSDNKVTINDAANTYLRQNNNTRFNNYVNTFQNTGNNDASFNTGGSVKIYTGDANSAVNINNQAGENKALVGGYGSYNTNYVDVSGNGAFSKNKVYLNDNSREKLFQNNNTRINNYVNTKQNTGRNYADFNTGYHPVKYFDNYGKDFNKGGYDNKFGSKYNDFFNKYHNNGYGDGSKTAIYTGNANSWTNLDNMANKNVAYLN